MVEQPGHREPKQSSWIHNENAEAAPVIDPRATLHSPGPGCHLYASVEGWFTLKVVHDDAMVAIDDVLVDALPPEVLQDLVDAVNSIQDGLKK